MTETEGSRTHRNERTIMMMNSVHFAPLPLCLFPMLTVIRYRRRQITQVAATAVICSSESSNETRMTGLGAKRNLTSSYRRLPITPADRDVRRGTRASASASATGRTGRGGIETGSPPAACRRHGRNQPRPCCRSGTPAWVHRSPVDPG